MVAVNDSSILNRPVRVTDALCPVMAFTMAYRLVGKLAHRLMRAMDHLAGAMDAARLLAKSIA